MNEQCKKGHEAKKDASGRLRCSTCDREKYREKHPYNKVESLRLSGHLAPRLRSMPKEKLNRRIGLMDNDGNVTGCTTYREVVQGVLHRQSIEFDVGDGVRPKTVSCENCHKPFEVNAQGFIASVCLEGCFRSCSTCKNEVTVKSARWFAKQGRKPLCRQCADVNRPKVTKCLRGHEFTPENTLLSPKTNQRFCRTCKRERMRQCRERKKKAA